MLKCTKSCYNRLKVDKLKSWHLKDSDNIFKYTMSQKAAPVRFSR